MSRNERSDISGLLHSWSGGDLGARDQLVPLIYEELRRRAAAYMRRERVGHTLQPTALVHEAFIRLINQDHPAWKNRSQFLGVASQMMRRVLVDRARTVKGTRRKAGEWVRVPLDRPDISTPPLDVRILDLDDALTELAAFDLRMSHIAEMRFFCGLTLAESADALGISTATVERDWQAARAWLYARLTSKPSRHDA